jgi:threonine synthase
LVAETAYSIYGAQAAGCSPISTAIKNNTETVRPVSKPQTIAKSLSIGTPADGYYAIRAMKNSGGTAEDCSDEEIINAIRLLAETEGIFAETAGGVTLACAQKLIANGAIPRDESIALCITGYGLKTQEAIAGHVGSPSVIRPNLRAFEELVEQAVQPI